MALKNNLVQDQGLIKLLLLVATFSFSSCRDRKREEVIAIVNEWAGKEIKFPENVPCYVSGQETLSEFCDDCFHKEFKILLYVDSTGCSSCRLQLFEWKQLIEEVDSLFQEKVGFLLFFQPKNLSDIDFLYIRDGFDYPVFIDPTGTINRLNQFPQAMQYQCFLLDGDNKVAAIGNPVSNMKIWELYKKQIADGKNVETNMITSALIDKVEHDYGTILKGSTNTATFTITNVGANPFIITRVSTSCGCTTVIWDKQPIEVGKTTTIQVELTPDEAGSIRKTITVYSNASESPMRLTITGTVINHLKRR